jgi:hypothetical protein
MGIYKPFRTGETFKLKDKFTEVRKDIMDNASEVRYRREFYSKKYRGNRLNDINIGIREEANFNYTVQIFIRNKEGWIRNNLLFNSKGNLLKSRMTNAELLNSING